MAFEGDIVDFYIKNPDMENYNPNKLTVKNPAEVIVNKLHIVIFTNKGDVLGDSNLGANLEHFIYTMNSNAETIKNVLNEQIKEYIPEMLSVGYKMDVFFFKSDFRDICLIDIEMNEEGVQIVFN